MSRQATLVLFSSLVLCASCQGHPPVFQGVDASTGRSLTLEQRPMAFGRSFTGSYASPQLGYLKLRQLGSCVDGIYEHRTCGKEVHGTLQGHARGNLLEVEFRETSLEDPSGESRQGRGYFLFSGAPPLDRPARLFGERTFSGPRLMSRGAPIWTERETSVWSAEAIDPARAGEVSSQPRCP